MICVMRTFCNGNVASEFPTETIIALPGIQHKTLMKINISQFCRRINADLLIYDLEAISSSRTWSELCGTEQRRIAKTIMAIKSMSGPVRIHNGHLNYLRF